jgi:SAM-dependent methyltransferase
MAGVVVYASGERVDDMSIRVAKLRELTAEQKRMLDQRMSDYYKAPPHSYYAIADQAAGQYQRELMPFHCDLVSRVKPDISVLEIGCGTAHLCPHVEAAGGHYTGIDHNESLLEGNRRRFPRARFFSVGEHIDESFDLVASLYAIEHVVDPPTYLENLWKFCQPGGLLGIICPDFIDGAGMPPSFVYGRTPRRLRQKIISLAFRDGFFHLLDLFWFAPRWKARACANCPGAFWINLEPRIFHGAEYTIDADAIHLPRLKDLIWWCESHGACIVATSQTIAGGDPDILRHNCYALARKPIG